MALNKNSGYCELTVGETTYPIKFGMGAWAIIAEERNSPMDKVFEGLSELQFVAWIVYGGINHACLAGYSDSKPLSSIHVAYDLIEELTGEQMGLVGKTFAATKVNGQTMKDIIDKLPAEKKKK